MPYDNDADKTLCTFGALTPDSDELQLDVKQYLEGEPKLRLFAVKEKKDGSRVESQIFRLNAAQLMLLLEWAASEGDAVLAKLREFAPQE